MRDAWRLARHEPGFAAIAIFTLALGVGAATTLFSLVNGVLLRPCRGTTPISARAGLRNPQGRDPQLPGRAHQRHLPRLGREASHDRRPHGVDD